MHEYEARISFNSAAQIRWTTKHMLKNKYMKTNHQMKLQLLNGLVKTWYMRFVTKMELYIYNIFKNTSIGKTYPSTMNKHIYDVFEASLTSSDVAPSWTSSASECAPTNRRVHLTYGKKISFSISERLRTTCVTHMENHDVTSRPLCSWIDFMSSWTIPTP